MDEKPPDTGAGVRIIADISRIPLAGASFLVRKPNVCAISYKAIPEAAGYSVTEFEFGYFVKEKVTASLSAEA